MKAYKIVNDQGCDYYTGTVLYEVGKTMVHPDPDRSHNGPCGRGYHVSPTPWHASGHNKPGRLFEVKIDKKNIIGRDDSKMRVSELVVVKELNKHRIYGPNYKKVLAKIERLKQPGLYFTATKPCPARLMNEVIRRHKPFTKAAIFAETKVFGSWDAARDAARAAARAAAWDAAWDAARDAAWDAAWAAALDAAWAAAWAAALAAAWAAALDAAWDAAWAAALDAAWAVVADKMSLRKNPYEAVVDLWLAGYLVYFDGEKMIVAYVKKEQHV